MTETKPPSTLRSLALGLGCGALCFACGAAPLLPGPDFLTWPGYLLISASPLFIFPLILAVLGLPYFLVVTVFSREERSWALRKAALCFGLAVGILPAFLGVMAVRNARFAAAANRAAPLIEAIAAHRTATGRWPESLDALVPSRLGELPGTGMMAYPEFKYRRSDGTDDLFRSYELSVSCSSGGINFDVFVYWPEQDYPDRMYGGGVQRIGNWAYVHE